MKIGIVGLGFVGLSLTSVLSSKGYDIIGIDVDKEKRKKISNGISPFFEPELENLLKNSDIVLDETVFNEAMIRNRTPADFETEVPQNTN